MKRVGTWPFSFEAYWALYCPTLSFIAEVEGRAVGFIVGTIAQEEHSHSVVSLRHTAEPPSRYQQVGWIDMMGIGPRYQHMGIGRRLIGAFHEECERNDAVVRCIASGSDVNTGCSRKHALGALLRPIDTAKLVTVYS